MIVCGVYINGYITYDDGLSFTVTAKKNNEFCFLVCSTGGTYVLLSFATSCKPEAKQSKGSSCSFL